MTLPFHVVVLAAGEGKRLGGSRAKVLTPLWGRPSVAYPVAAALALDPDPLVVVCGDSLEQVRVALGGEERIVFARQEHPRGTGDALLAAREALSGGSGPLLILYGDCPLISTELLAELLQAHREEGASLTMLTAELDDPAGYGRVIRDAEGLVEGIVEAGDADEEALAIEEINAGIWVLETPTLFEDLESLGTDNAQSEVYLTDLVALIRSRGGTVAAVCADDPADVLGFNDPAELAVARRLLRERILLGHLAAGVEILDPESTFIDADVTIEAGARILPCTVIEGRTRIAAGCEVGPFAHLRDGTTLAAGAEVGNFTETKKAVLGEGAKAKHLSYLGDTTIGPGTNIGAGTITANYDGQAKHPTSIGSGAFIGSGTVLVAPVTVEDGGVTGAGAIVKRRSVVGTGETWVGVPARPLQKKTDPDAPTGQPPPQP